MRILIALILSLSAIVLIASCKKSGKTAFATPSLYIPWNLDTVMQSTDGHYLGDSKLNVSGIMIACKVSGSLTDTSGHTSVYSRNWEAALFAGSAGTLTAGVKAVSVNTVPLSIDWDGYFVNHDTMVTWNEGAINHWYVAGSDTIPAISADVAGIMPAFTGALPVSISRSSDFSFTFNSSNTTNGDSAFVILYAQGITGGIDPFYSTVVSANGGSAIISVARLSNFKNTYVPLFYTSPLYYSGLIMLVIYNHTIQTFGDKQFAFVKQTEVVGVVNFL